MKALRFEAGRLRVAEMGVPDQDGEALIRVVKSGICNTDLEIVRGYANFEGTIGHEFVGVVESGPDDWKGKRIVGEINVGCGICDLCSGNDSRHCPKRTVLGIHGRDGAHAEFLALPIRNLIEVPDGVSDEEAVFVEPLAAAYGISEQVDIGSQTRVAVVGDGKLGLLCAFCMRLLSYNVVLVGKHKDKLEHAFRRDIETILLKDAGGLKQRFDVVIEASGSESGFATALDLVRPRGKLVLKSTFHGTPTWEAWRVVVDEITVVGSRCGRFAPVLELLASKHLQVADLVSEEYGLSSGLEAVGRASHKGIMKVLLDPTG
ncbi:MAG TPA: alcohol dehydrogenase catalytic domain-containing protein [Pyrinomonadaceae bacterium]|nr:alcohol dehydrogenase catalytic domain-containing protein [Pyrinomonadaceae bacterium]